MKEGIILNTTKIFLIILLFLISLSAITIYYFFEKKEYKTEDKKVDEVLNSDYSIQLPTNETAIESNENAATNISEAANIEHAQKSNETLLLENNNEEVNDNTQSSQGNLKNTSSLQQNNIQVQLTADSINKKYEPSFLELQTQANGKLNTLISIAFEEYKAKKNNQEKISYPYFYSKYVSAARSIESNTDIVFDQIYSALSSELVQNGFNEEDAKIFQKQYENEKKARKTAILKRAKEAIN